MRIAPAFTLERSIFLILTTFSYLTHPSISSPQHSARFPLGLRRTSSRLPLAIADPFPHEIKKPISTPSNNNSMQSTINSLQDIIGNDAGGRGMKSLIVPGDLFRSSVILADLPPNSHVLILSGFPCCVNESPPTETDGPPGTLAIARAVVKMGHTATVVTDDCNQVVFAAATQQLAWGDSLLKLRVFPAERDVTPADEDRLRQLVRSCDVIVACERAGPGADGHCYTMRGIDMTAKNLIAPLHNMIGMKSDRQPFLAIGDGGNELGMGKVLRNITGNPQIKNGEKIGCVVAADHLIAASVSNWGGYALGAGVALVRAHRDAGKDGTKSLDAWIREWIEKCVPTEEEEVSLLERCVKVGCRDGVSGKVEATVDGMPLETSLECLRDIRKAVLKVTVNL